MCVRFENDVLESASISRIDSRAAATVRDRGIDYRSLCIFRIGNREGRDQERESVTE